MTKKLSVLLLLFVTQIAAQKVVQKTILENKDTSIQINASNCFFVNLKTNKTDQVKVAAKMSGEYGNDISLNLHEEGNTLVIDTKFIPSFEMPNDKLGAHKVVSINLEISIPENMRVRLYGTSSNINCTGFFDDLDISLSDGKCILRNVIGTSKVTTQDGAIDVYTYAGKIDALSKYGKVVTDKISESDNQFKLSSVTGDIHIYKTN